MARVVSLWALVQLTAAAVDRVSADVALLTARLSTDIQKDAGRDEDNIFVRMGFCVNTYVLCASVICSLIVSMVDGLMLLLLIARHVHTFR